MNSEIRILGLSFKFYNLIDRFTNLTSSFFSDLENFEQPSLLNEKGITSTQPAIKCTRRFPICGKLQSCQANLDRHLRIHTRDKPYASEKCG